MTPEYSPLSPPAVESESIEEIEIQQEELLKPVSLLSSPETETVRHRTPSVESTVSDSNIP